MPTVLVSPLDERIHQDAKPASRLDTLKGKRLALLDISKPGGSVFFDRLETLLTERYGVASILRIAKPTFAKPAPDDVLAKIRDAQVHAAIEALADWGSCTTCSLHDSTALEAMGIPTVPVATHTFRTAARAQAAGLGRPDFDAVYVPHPIQDQTPEEIQQRADDVIAEIVSRLTAP